MQHSKTSALIIMAILVGSVAFSAAVPALAQSTADQREFQLVVIPIASKLPADNGEYPIWIQLQTVKDSAPVQAPYDLNVTLATSDSSIIITSQRVTIAAEDSMVMTNIKTTAKAGAAEITAIADGVTFGKSTITTVKLGSLEPSILSIHAGSSKFIPNPGFPGKIYVQLLNSANVPAVTTEQLTVYLSSSNTQVGNVPFFVNIPAGSSGILVDFTPTFQQGTTTLTASANGFSPGQIGVKTVGPVGNKVVLEMAPPTIPAPVGFYSFLTIQIRDSTDMPVKADKPMTVTLSSSNTNVADIPSQITIPAGSSYVVERVKSKGTIGATAISASIQGLSPGSLTVNTINTNWGTGESPNRISVFAIPSKIAPDNKESANIIVQVTDASGNPYSFQGFHYNNMNLYSSDPAIQITSAYLITEATFAVGTARSSSEGIATVTASKSGYSPGSTSIASKGSLPVGLELAPMRTVVLANNVVATAVIASIVDSKGNPTFAQNDVVISLSSSQSDVATVERSEYILKGQSFALIEINPIRAGTTMITASAQGLAPSSLQLKTVGSTGDSSSYTLGIKTVPKMLADGRAYEAVFVQLQSADENPVPAASDVVVNLSSSSASAGSVESKVTVKAGSTFATAQLTPTTTPSKFKISASSSGYTTVSTEVVTSAQPLTIVRTSELPRSTEFESMSIGVDVFAAGVPAANALVRVSGTSAETTEALTDENGHAELMYIPTEPGRNSVIVTATKPGYRLTTATFPITLEQNVSVYVGAKTEAEKPIALQAKIASSSTTKTVNVKAGVPSGLDGVKWGTYRISVPDEFTAAGARYQFVSWSDGVVQNPRSENIIRDVGFTAVYSAEYYLTAVTERGSVVGAGYYPEGEMAAFSISQTRFNGFPVDKSFAGWSGDIKVASASAEILMDGPKTVTAEWDTDYLKLLAMFGSLGGGGFMAYHKVIRPKREAKKKERSPDLDWYKS